MPLTVACICGKTLQLKDELAGKKIKCPACQAVVEVPAAQAPTAATMIDDEPPPARKPRRVVEDDDEEDEAPRPKKKSRKPLLFLGLGCGVLTLGMCCIGGGIFATVLYLRGSGAEVVGKWEAEGVVNDKGDFLTKTNLNGMSYEFDSLSGYRKAQGVQSIKGGWRVSKRADNKIFLELTPEGAGLARHTVEIRLVDQDHIDVKHPFEMNFIRFKRIP